MHKCYSNHAYIHGYCSSCIWYFIIFSSLHLTLSFSLWSDSHLTLSSSTDLRCSRRCWSPMVLIIWSMLSPLPIGDGFNWWVWWFWWVGFDDFDPWVLIRLMVVGILMDGLMMKASGCVGWWWRAGYWLLMVAGYWSGWWWLGFDNFDLWVLIGLMMVGIFMGGLMMRLAWWWRLCGLMMEARYWLLMVAGFRIFYWINV